MKSQCVAILAFNTSHTDDRQKSFNIACVLQLISSIHLIAFLVCQFSSIIILLFYMLILFCWHPIHLNITFLIFTKVIITLTKVDRLYQQQLKPNILYFLKKNLTVIKDTIFIYRTRQHISMNTFTIKSFIVKASGVS